ncbi:hypothetical protein BS50DRAFT_582450 [Corynespora cassiicola Philippines]|uniref:C2H2-type domain-containing protein n=1 Tax=Corynespora cassiicola Philippines TaxID=1448308 RepID=A0A2T2P537_CORCC|nr:hypothetical protein BS50DRAFT_582450 [Corynespora cassiicola Philippines]
MRGYDPRMDAIVKEPYEVDSSVHEMFASEFQQAAVYSNPYEAQPPTNAYELEAGVGSNQQVPYYIEPYQHSQAQFEFPEAGHNAGMYSFQRDHFAQAGTPTLGIAIPNTPPEMYAGPFSSGPSSGGPSAGEAATFTPASSTRSGGSPTGSQDSCNFHHSPLSQGFGAVRDSASSLGSQSPQHLQYNAQPPTPHASTWICNGVEPGHSCPSSAIVTPLNTARGQSYDASLPYSMAQNHPTQFPGTAEIGATTHLVLEITKVSLPQCGQCNKTFLGHYGKSNLTRHKKTVHSAASHPCSICGKYFKRTDALKKHSDKKHKLPLQDKTRMPMGYPTSPMFISELAGSSNHGPST